MAADGKPEVGPTARTLGVRPNVDLPVFGGLVRSGTGGLSVAPDDAGNFPTHRLPPSLGGIGKDAVWSIAIDRIGGGLTFRQDKPKHGLIEPAREMTSDTFQRALADTAPSWEKVT
ncbi:MAG TPA: hypothetical protein VG406_09515 [Isosphaeraceae bacterium]|nr:hypothetical protein [Isosphaeraceae bacterium]